MVPGHRAPKFAFIAAIGLVLALASLSPAAAATCDRACLKGMIDRYVDAVVAHDASKLPLAANVRVTENSQDVKIGDGMDKTVTGKAGFRQDYLDTAKGIAASHMVLLEGKNQLLYSVLLHVRDGRIAGVETLVQRITPDSRFQPTEFGGPIRGMNDPIPPGKRETRAAMIRIALGYPEGLRIGDFTQGGTRFASETYRVENGVITAGVGCKRPGCGMYEQKIMKHPDVKANVAAVDEENGVVLLWMNFGDTNSYGPGNALVTFEAFKVWGGQIHAVNAFFPILPVATQRGWPASDPQ